MHSYVDHIDGNATSFLFDHILEACAKQDFLFEAFLIRFGLPSVGSMREIKTDERQADSN
jgi:hypothetical protein